MVKGFTGFDFNNDDNFYILDGEKSYKNLNVFAAVSMGLDFTSSNRTTTIKILTEIEVEIFVQYNKV